MDNFWIIGSGKFGRKAARELGRAGPPDRITIVDHNKEACRQVSMPGCRTVCMDGIAYLDRYLTGADYPDWIVPAIPVHVAYEWIRLRLSPKNALRAIPVPAGLGRKLPNPIKGKAGQLYISIADFKCPENCPEPPEICTYTGKPRPMILYEFLKTIRHKDFESIVIRGHQLAPGVGGYQPRALFDALREIENTRVPVLLSTACSCHGVMHALNFLTK